LRTYRVARDAILYGDDGGTAELPARVALLRLLIAPEENSGGWITQLGAVVVRAGLGVLYSIRPGIKMRTSKVLTAP
jgi:hypothetical protein